MVGSQTIRRRQLEGKRNCELPLLGCAKANLTIRLPNKTLLGSLTYIFRAQSKVLVTVESTMGQHGLARKQISGSGD